MKIRGLENMSSETVNFELARGAKFVSYKYCISILIMTFTRSSDIYFIKSGEGRTGKGIPFTLISLFCGWWGFPWGPIHTIGSVFTNFRGGKDLTAEVLNSINSQS